LQLSAAETLGGVDCQGASNFSDACIKLTHMFEGLLIEAPQSWLLLTRPETSSAKSLPPGVKAVSVGLTDVLPSLLLSKSNTNRSCDIYDWP